MSAYKLGRTFGNRTSSTIEITCLFDFVCPFSKRAYKRMRQIVTEESSVMCKFIVQCQPWHPQSYHLACAAAAASIYLSADDDDRFFTVVDALYARQDDFFDHIVFRQSSLDIHKQLCEIVTKACGMSVEEYWLLACGTGVAGVAVASGGDGEIRARNLIKKHVKFSRQNGVHVSPTFMINGIIDNNVSSAWSKEQWEEKIAQLLAERP